MYLKKIEGPRSVTLPNGRVMTRADLPPADTTRWVASRKASVVRAVAYGLISQKQAVEMYDLSDEEFISWCRAIREHGENALKVTALPQYRQL